MALPCGGPMCESCIGSVDSTDPDQRWLASAWIVGTPQRVAAARVSAGVKVGLAKRYGFCAIVFPILTDPSMHKAAFFTRFFYFSHSSLKAVE